MRRLASKRIRELLQNDADYLRLRSQYYSWLWHRYQDAFGVTSYTDTRSKYFEAAQDFIRSWQPIEIAKMASGQ